MAATLLHFAHISITASISPKQFSATQTGTALRITCPSRNTQYHTCTANHTRHFQIKEEAQPGTLDYHLYFVNQSGKNVSPWHDIQLHLCDGIFNFVVEIPKDTCAKMEVATNEPFTPIKQDTNIGKLRHCPYGVHWNYGLLPQTWEDPSFAKSEVEQALGDNDPVDVVEIGERRKGVGQILNIKLLAAALAVIDEGNWIGKFFQFPWMIQNLLL